MTVQQQFGGDWTDDKLSLLKKYLDAYQTALKNQSFAKVYVDAFAGTGSLPIAMNAYDDQVDAGVKTFLKGSAGLALDVQPPFDRYIFIEQNSAKCAELEALRKQHPLLTSRIHVENADATTFLESWCRTTNWKSTRAVMFLDPFGMQVPWSLLETIAATEAIDLWLLVPIGMGANRLLTKDGLPSEAWADKLTRFFGNDEWRSKFYGPKRQPGLFDDGSEVEKTARHDDIANYFVERLGSIFAGVANNPLTQRNSKNSPLFLLCFATATRSEKGKALALKFAQHILK